MSCIIFTDLDGTLLGHSDYSYQPAKEFIAQLKRLSIPVVINTSKTLQEVQSWHDKLELQGPFVFENGGGIALGDRVESLGTASSEIISILKKARESFQFRGFSEMEAQELCERTNLSPQEAEAAKKRLFTEPVVWQDSPDRIPEFIKWLKEYQLIGLQGGRFLHIQGQHDKSSAIPVVVKSLNMLRSKVVALGDSENDKSMLEAADYAVVIPSGHKATLKIQHARVITASETAPSGWVSGLTEVMKQLAYL